jgi:hypothetical protein
MASRPNVQRLDQRPLTARSGHSVKACLTTGLALSHDVEATHAANVVGASTSNNGPSLSRKRGDASTLALRIVRADLVAICGGADTSLSTDKYPLDLATLCSALVSRLRRESRNSIPELDVGGAPETGEKHYGDDDTMSAHARKPMGAQTS